MTEQQIHEAIAGLQKTATQPGLPYHCVRVIHAMIRDWQRLLNDDIEALRNHDD